jgi:hypothetical protein
MKWAKIVVEVLIFAFKVWKKSDSSKEFDAKTLVHLTAHEVAKEFARENL